MYPPFITGAIFVSLLVIAVYFFTKRQPAIRIPKELKGTSLVPMYDPPKDLTSFDAGTLIGQKFDVRDVVSVVIDLAMRGYLKIRYTQTAGLKLADFEFLRLKDGFDLSHYADRETFALLFNVAGPGSVIHPSVKLSDLRRKKWRYDAFHRLLIQKGGKYLEKNGQVKFDRDRFVFYLLSSIGTLFFTVSFVVLTLEYDSMSEFLDVIGLSIIFGGLGLIMMRLSSRVRFFTLTNYGIETVKHLLGFRFFLSSVESEKYKLLNAPHMEPEFFEKYLPYAIAFGVENEWAGHFVNVRIQQPLWIDGLDMVFSPAACARFFDDFLSEFRAALTAQPKTELRD